MQTFTRSLLLFCAVVAVFWFLDTFFRFSALIAAATSLVLPVCCPALRQRGFWFSALAAFLLLSFLPADLSLRTRPGLPQFVRVSYGLSNQYTIESARRGEIILGGCCITGHEPRWVLVW